MEPRCWPKWPVLPVKNYREPGDIPGFPKQGVLIDTPNRLLTIVYMVNMYMLNAQPIEQVPQVKFDSVDDLLAAGWEVD